MNAGFQGSLVRKTLKYIISTLTPKQNKPILRVPQPLGDQLIGRHGDATCLGGMNQGLDEGRERKDLRLYLPVCSLDRPLCAVTEEGGY